MLRIVSPAPYDAILQLALPAARMRKAMLWQVRKHDSLAVYCEDAPLAVAMFRQRPFNRIELAVAISRRAAPHMRGLVRIAHLTLARLCDHATVFAIIDPGNEAGLRMAKLIGLSRRYSAARHWKERKDGNIRGQLGCKGCGEKPRSSADIQ